MSTTVDIELVPSEEDRLLEPVQEATTVDMELMPTEEDRLLETVLELPLQSKHPIFLSHSGAQKNFVEQLCLDLEHQLHHTPFFDKRPDSLPKGEVFAQYIFEAAQHCELAIVVVSEEYFSRSKWPMLELSVLVHSSKRKILPLFFGLSCKEFGDAERRERWFQTWEAWAQMDPRVSVKEWKLALREVDRRNGLEFVAAVGEVGYRKEVLATVSAILPPEWVKVEKEEVRPHMPIFNRRGVLSRLLFGGPSFILKFIGLQFCFRYLQGLLSIVLPSCFGFAKRSSSMPQALLAAELAEMAAGYELLSQTTASFFKLFGLGRASPPHDFHRILGVRGWLVSVIALGCLAPLVQAQESNLLLTDTANFLDAGLTALGLVTALVTTIMRRRLDAETNTRDLLTLLGGESQGSVKTLAVGDQHSLSQVLMLVEENSKAWAHQMFSYYGATTAKRAELLPVAWLCPPPRDPNVVLAKCSCFVTCKCLKFERVEGVSKHLTTVAPGTVFRVDDTYDALICSSCFARNCHNANSAYYQDAGAGIQGALGPQDHRRPGCRRTLSGSAATLFAAKGHTGLILVEPANEESVTWAPTISEASTVKDAEERGNENPFTVSYRNGLAGEATPADNETEFDPAQWWLSRLCTFILSSTLVILFRTDAFSSALLARRAMRGYMVDSTQTKLPLSSFCSKASCSMSLEDRFIVVTLEPIHGRMSLPKHKLMIASALEALLVLVWIAIIAVTPRFHLVGSSYLRGVPIWAAAVSCLVAIVASFVNVHYWRMDHSIWRFRYGVFTALCGFVDLSLLVLSALSWAKVVAAAAHWVATLMRALVMVAAILQWVLGVTHLPTTTNSTRNQKGWSLVVPYALTFLRLLTLVAGGGRWA